ncbi:hypothetical protein NXS19_008374 [Fusarium pseudograminearum]|nr:hypothetical protein NXS19_008374 [Fusarium pseudograminearum]
MVWCIIPRIQSASAICSLSLRNSFLVENEDKDFWTANVDVLVETCRSMMEPWESPVQIEEFLIRSRGDLHEAFFDYFKSTVQVVRETLETDPAMQARVEAVTKGVKRRASGDMFSEEFDLGSDVEDGDVAMEDQEDNGTFSGTES